MTFHATPMFPGDLYDTTARVAAAAPVAETFESQEPSETWSQFLQLGWQGVLIDEAHDGAGASLGDVAAIAEAAGRHALAQPLAARCAVVPLLLAGLPGASDVLRAMAAGEASVCPVLDTGPVPLAAVRDGDRLTLNGRLHGADLTEPATHFVFVATQDDGLPLLVLAPRDAVPGHASTWLGIDGRQTADIALAGVTLAASSVLAQGEDVYTRVERASAVGGLLACAQTVGAIGAMIEQTIEYLTTRVQFGVALATFQALRHRVVEMYVAYENVRGMVRRQVLDLCEGPASGSPRDIALVKLYLSVTGRQVAESAIQLHGGIGMSRELPAARLAMHALACSLQWGDRFAHLDRLARPALH
ncbi:acyl-CoA dehydrogenase [Acidovorax sp. SUPP2539]|uniref:acyl-CoA dehydrogenase family protein n=1 Tax=Acidovorax sp. SUPP2539 TaxID=2920878 RepID=UPI0023DE5656|nr:acyl-CoA dehydrogenase [Acidovorax sp. SUPP2539]GKS89730.1 acyl-CoA dehydrogenase [Acidovorax sp. SUPP2539]